VPDVGDGKAQADLAGSIASLWGGKTQDGAPAPVAPPTTPPAPTAPAAVELTQCRFDKVEAALAAAKGKVVLVDCWARWCPPCVTSFPKLVEKHEKYAPRAWCA
jgi:thiol-disulfide isomerase/thioredoxin